MCHEREALNATEEDPSTQKTETELATLHRQLQKNVPAAEEDVGPDRCSRGCALPPDAYSPAQSSGEFSNASGWFCPLCCVVLGEGERQGIAGRSVLGRPAHGQRALQGQPLHRKLVGVDQPAVSRGSTDSSASGWCPPWTARRRTLMATQSPDWRPGHLQSPEPLNGGLSLAGNGVPLPMGQEEGALRLSPGV